MFYTVIKKFKKSKPAYMLLINAIIKNDINQANLILNSSQKPPLDLLREVMGQEILVDRIFSTSLEFINMFLNAYVGEFNSFDATHFFIRSVRERAYDQIIFLIKNYENIISYEYKRNMLIYSIETGGLKRFKILYDLYVSQSNEFKIDAFDAAIKYYNSSVLGFLLENPMLRMQAYKNQTLIYSLKNDNSNKTFNQQFEVAKIIGLLNRIPYRILVEAIGDNQTDIAEQVLSNSEIKPSQLIEAFKHAIEIRNIHIASLIIDQFNAPLEHHEYYFRLIIESDLKQLIVPFLNKFHGVKKSVTRDLVQDFISIAIRFKDLNAIKILFDMFKENLELYDSMSVLDIYIKRGVPSDFDFILKIAPIRDSILKLAEGDSDFVLSKVRSSKEKCSKNKKKDYREIEQSLLNIPEVKFVDAVRKNHPGTVFALLLTKKYTDKMINFFYIKSVEKNHHHISKNIYMICGGQITSNVKERCFSNIFTRGKSKMVGFALEYCLKDIDEKMKRLALKYLVTSRKDPRILSIVLQNNEFIHYAELECDFLLSELRKRALPPDKRMINIILKIPSIGFLDAIERSESEELEKVIALHKNILSDKIPQAIQLVIKQKNTKTLKNLLDNFKEAINHDVLNEIIFFLARENNHENIDFIFNEFKEMLTRKMICDALCLAAKYSSVDFTRAFLCYIELNSYPISETVEIILMTRYWSGIRKESKEIFDLISANMKNKEEANNLIDEVSIELQNICLNEQPMSLCLYNAKNNFDKGSSNEIAHNVNNLSSTCDISLRKNRTI